MDYNEFAALAAQYGLDDITQEEYNENVVPFPDVSVSAKMRRIKNSRSGKIGQRWRKMIAYALGSRDHTWKDVTLEESDKVYVTLQDKATGHLEEMAYRGEFVKMGRLCEIQVEEGVAKSGNAWSAIREVIYQEESWRPTKANWQEPAAAGRAPLYKPILIAGEIKGFWGGVKDWESPKKTAVWDYNQGNYPCCKPYMEQETEEGSVMIFFDFGPYKDSHPLIRGMSEWNMKSSPSLEKLKGWYIGAKVGIIGKVQNQEDSVYEGKDVIYVNIKAVGIVDMEAHMAGGPPVTQASSAAVAAAPVAAPAAPGPLPPHLAEKVEALMGDVAKGLKHFPDATPAQLQQANYVNSTVHAQLIAMAIRRVKEGVVATVVEGLVTNEYNDTNVCMSCHFMKNNVSSGSGSCHECDTLPPPPSEVAKIVTMGETLVEQTDDGATLITPVQAVVVSSDRKKASIRRALKNVIKKHDETGSGAEYDVVVSTVLGMGAEMGVESKDVEEVLDDFFDDGTVYEPTLGKIKLI